MSLFDFLTDVGDWVQDHILGFDGDHPSFDELTAGTAADPTAGLPPEAIPTTMDPVVNTQEMISNIMKCVARATRYDGAASQRL